MNFLKTLINTLDRLKLRARFYNHHLKSHRLFFFLWHPSCENWRAGRLAGRLAWALRVPSFSPYPQFKHVSLYCAILETLSCQAARILYYTACNIEYILEIGSLFLSFSHKHSPSLWLSLTLSFTNTLPFSFLPLALSHTLCLTSYLFCLLQLNRTLFYVHTLFLIQLPSFARSNFHAIIISISRNKKYIPPAMHTFTIVSCS